MRSWSWLTKREGVVRGDIGDGEQVQKGDVVRNQTIFFAVSNHPIQPNQQSDLYKHSTQLTRISSHIFNMSSADDQYEQQNDVVDGDVPAGDAGDDSYKSRTGQSHIPVQSDNAPVEDPIDAATADSDETLGMSASFSMLFHHSMLIFHSER